jgi:hypothetical protein
LESLISIIANYTKSITLYTLTHNYNLKVSIYLCSGLNYLIKILKTELAVNRLTIFRWLEMIKLLIIIIIE